MALFRKQEIFQSYGIYVQKQPQLAWIRDYLRSKFILAFFAAKKLGSIEIDWEIFGNILYISAQFLFK